MSEKPSLRIRFNLNQRTGAESNAQVLQKAGANFRATVIQKVGLRAAENKYIQLKREIRREIAGDVQREIANIAKLYTRHAVGRPGGRNRVITLRAATTPETGPALFGLWKPLAASTVARKGHSKHFQDSGRLGFIMGVKQVWEEAFGPVVVRISKLDNSKPIADASLYKDQGDKHHFKVAEISVAAMGRVTAEMLPELNTNPVQLGRSTHNGREKGLLNLLDSVDPNLKQRLGNWGRSGKGSYRPTLEPFLAFAIGRAIPQAVFRRIKMRNSDYSGRNKTALAK
jgi:hypothetical protein